MREFKVMVVGAYGFFGSRLVARLARQSGLHIVVAGRSASAAQALVESLAPGACSSLSHAVLDVMVPGLEDRLKTLEVDTGHFERLIGMMPVGTVRVAESGIRSGRDAKRLRSLGYHAFLVGERFMTDADPGAALAAFRADATKLEIDLSPIDGVKVLELLSKAAATPKSVIARYNEIVPTGN